MAQINMFETGWIDIINRVITEITKNEELPSGALQLIENLSRDKEKVSSYSVAVLKPDYPKGVNPNGRAKNTLLNIKRASKKNDTADTLIVSIPDSVLPMVNSRFPNVPLVKKKSDSLTRASIASDSDELKDFFNFLVKAVLDKYFTEGSDAFGCCSRYEECSDAKKCLHENILYARNCIYGAHLAKGRIFYGKIRNV